MLKTVCLSLALAVTGIATGASAQNLRTDLVDAGPPAEFPPASFSGRQYVDSRGCVYVRAGAIGEASWVPRVTGNRKVLCGFKPTAFTRTARADLPVIPDPAPSVAPAAPERTATAASRITATPAPRTTATAPRVIAAPTPRSVAQAPAPQATAGLRPKPYRAARNVSAAELAAEPVTAAPRRGVASHPRSVATRPRAMPQAAAAPQRVRATAQTGNRIGRPLDVFDLQVGDQIRVRRAPPVKTPPGYRKAWNDGRLNPNRGKQTFNGALQSQLVWTQTVPRRLKTASGKDVTAKHHYLIYPYTDYNKQLADLRGGKLIAVRTGGQRQIVPRSSLRTRPDGTVVMASKSAQAPEVARTASADAKAAGARFVQVGTFGNPANAQATAQRLQRAGLPVRLSRFTKGGTSYRIVLAGPFADNQGLSRGLTVVRQQGFRDAFVR